MNVPVCIRIHTHRYWPKRFDTTPLKPYNTRKSYGENIVACITHLEFERVTTPTLDPFPSPVQKHLQQSEKEHLPKSLQFNSIQFDLVGIDDKAKHSNINNNNIKTRIYLQPVTSDAEDLKDFAGRNQTYRLRFHCWKLSDSP